tara:strand:- start:60 stop:392 length:333 start_codon:yes stop_codon:yes gene_type:complete
MPTQRRRIGFLPRSEVQNIIDKISTHNKLSQSKVTGILVEEALNSRGVLNNSIKRLSFDFSSNDSEMPKDVDTINVDNVSINEEVQMINDFIEFKFFKKIMIRNKRNIEK